MTDAFPRAFGSRHVLLKPLGMGGMGQVFMAVSGGRVCAVKTLLDGESDPRIAGRLEKEARLLTRLAHPNIVYVSDVGMVEGRLQLTMEYLRGKTLREVWQQCAETKRPIPFGVALFVIREILRALGYLHSQEGTFLVHRDVAPANVMLTYEGAVKLIDLGLAKETRRAKDTVAGLDWGQDAYRSPEQAAGRAVDARSDIFSVGVILWEILTGQPFDVRWKTGAARERCPVPSSLAPAIPREVDGVVLTALAVRPDDRYSSAAEFADVISRGLLSPDQDATSLKAFLAEIFADRIVVERESEESLVAQAGPASPSGGVSERTEVVAGASRAKAEATRHRHSRRNIAIAAAIGTGALIAAAVILGVGARRPPPSPVPFASTVGAAQHADPQLIAPRPSPAIGIMPLPPVTAPDATTIHQARPAPRPSAGSPRPAGAPPSAKQVEPTAPSADEYLDRAEQAYRIGHYVDAMNQARASIKREDTIDGRLVLGKVLLQLERFDDAAAEYQAVLSRNPGNQRAARGLDLAQHRGQ